MLWCLHLADGLDYLHSRPNPIIHRDLRPANMLLFNECTLLKICDFGTSKIYIDDPEMLQTLNEGTKIYMAPEVKSRTCLRSFYDLSYFA